MAAGPTRMAQVVGSAGLRQGVTRFPAAEPGLHRRQDVAHHARQQVAAGQRLPVHGERRLSNLGKNLLSEPLSVVTRLRFPVHGELKPDAFLQDWPWQPVVKGALASASFCAR